jgi:hypothetical protein
MNLNEQREFMRNNNLEMSKKLDKIIVDAKPKPIIEKRPIIPKRIIIEQDITGTPEYKATRQLSDLLLTQNLNNIITGAMNSISGNRTEKDNKVSQEVQDDFRAMNPVEVGDEKRLYYDVPIPTLPEFVPKPPTTHFTTEEEFIIERERLLTGLNTVTERRALIQQEIQNIEDQLNDKAYATPTGFKPSMPVYDEKARAVELKAMTEAYEKIPTLDKAGKPVKDKAGKPQFTKGKPIQDLNPLLDLRDKYKLKTTAGTLSGLIRALIAHEKKYYQEAVASEESAYVGEKVTRTEASLQSDLIRFKADLKTVEGQIASIETDLTALNAEHDAFLRNIEENEVERNKIENERRLLANDALNTFNRLNQGRVQIQQEPQETDKELLDRIENLGKIQADPSDIKNQIFDKAKKNVSQLTPNTTTAELVLKNLSSDEQHMMNKIFPKIKKNFVETFGSNNKDISESDISEFIKDQISSHPFKATPAPAPEAPAEAPAEAPPEDRLVAEIGSGIAYKVLPSNFAFGKIKIDLNKLFYRNILSIKDRKGKQINGQMNKHVSDNFVEIIFKILENRNITKTDLKNIHSERILYDNLIVQSGIHKSKNIPTTIEDTAPEMKNRLGLITGEIEAGNSNKALLKELHELVFKMAQINLISRSAATNYYNNIKSNYFSDI